MKSHARELAESLSQGGTPRRGGGRRAGGLGALGSEIIGEIAAALGRSEERVNASLARLGDLGRQIDRLEQGAAPADGAAWVELVEAFNAERGVAERRLWELMVHREALGLFRHELLFELFPIPAPRRIAK